ncbi:MAG: type II toxin-antitoxin system VapC family toxin [Candidatus Electrothrix sp. AUS1_2]|nr:type II toxin-antitoxin system VapC family toxin [Candidatus Electrothrix sp. AUS1_2]
MKKIIIDTNCLLSFVTDRNPDQQEKVARLFQEAAQLKTAILCHHHVISEFVFVLGSVYGIDAEKIQKILSDLIVMPGVLPIAEVNIKSVLALWPAVIADYGDAVLASCCQNRKGTAVVTFDKKFIKAMKREGIAIYPLGFSNRSATSRKNQLGDS